MGVAVKPKPCTSSEKDRDDGGIVRSLSGIVCSLSLPAQRVSLRQTDRQSPQVVEERTEPLGRGKVYNTKQVSLRTGPQQSPKTTHGGEHGCRCTCGDKNMDFSRASRPHQQAEAPKWWGLGGRDLTAIPSTNRVPRDILTAPCCECVWVFKME